MNISIGSTIDVGDLLSLDCKDTYYISTPLSHYLFIMIYVLKVVSSMA